MKKYQTIVVGGGIAALTGKIASDCLVKIFKRKKK
jgi:hypothetical protein